MSFFDVYNEFGYNESTPSGYSEICVSTSAVTCYPQSNRAISNSVFEFYICSYFTSCDCFNVSRSFHTDHYSSSSSPPYLNKHIHVPVLTCTVPSCTIIGTQYVCIISGHHIQKFGVIRPFTIPRLGLEDNVTVHRIYGVRAWIGFIWPSV
jgi:hypothetical protein